jgi:hypothetical protein
MSVIQGSLLGPTLFLIFINDFPNCTSLNTFLFADDTSALKSGPNLPELFESINNELNKITVWYRANKMSANAAKTKYIIFHNKDKRINTAGLDLLFNDNDPSAPPNLTISTPLNESAQTTQTHYPVFTNSWEFILMKIYL